MLCANFLFVLKKRADEVHLDPRHHHHHDQVDHRPEVDSFKVALLDVAVPSLKGSQQSLDLYAFAQPSFNVVDGVLQETNTSFRDAVTQTTVILPCRQEQLPSHVIRPRTVESKGLRSSVARCSVTWEKRLWSFLPPPYKTLYKKAAN